MPAADAAAQPQSVTLETAERDISVTLLTAERDTNVTERVVPALGCRHQKQSVGYIDRSKHWDQCYDS
jgi:hypothetical protein